MTAATVSAPSLSQIFAWSTDHLEDAALHWSRIADSWEHEYAAIHREAIAPGGTTWFGAAADAAAVRTGADRAVVNTAADMLHAAAKTARRGIDEIAVARKSVMQAIEVARAAGFVVGEDLSISYFECGGSRAQQAQRHAQAEMVASEVRARAEKLMAVDAEVGDSVMSTIEALHGIHFEDSPLDGSAVQAVDYSPVPETPIFDPGLPGDPVGKGSGPTGAQIWSVIDKLPRGDKPWIREVRTVQDLTKLWEWMKQTGVEIANPYGESGKGIGYNLPDSSRISQRFRAGSTQKPALDIDLPGQEHTKIHINPRGGAPQIPTAPQLPAEASRPLPPTESSSVRGGGLPGRTLGGGVLPDNSLPHFVEPPRTKELPVIGDGRPDPEA